MRDKLIELIAQIEREYAEYHSDCEEAGVTIMTSFEDMFADYLLAEGVIVPPCKACKVGDMVYAFCEDFGVVLPYFVENLNIGFMDKNRNYWTYEANCHAEETDELLDEIDFDLDDIGKTVFLTREEAEKALERIEQ